MHPILTEHLVSARIADLHREAAHERLVREAKKARPRRVRPLAWIAGLASALTPSGSERPGRRTLGQSRRPARSAC